MNQINQKLLTDAALHFLDGQFLFCYKTDDGGQVSKYVTIDDVNDAFSLVDQDSNWLPEGIRRVGTCRKGKWYIYTAPPQKVEIMIDPDEKLVIPIPHTVMFGIGRDHFIYALAEDFSPDAKLYRAPFPNVYNTGKICWGNSKHGKADPRKAESTWKMFFSTPFNHDLITEKSQQQPDDILEFLRFLGSKNRRKYPVKDLVLHGSTMKGFVGNMTRRY